MKHQAREGRWQMAIGVALALAAGCCAAETAATNSPAASIEVSGTGTDISSGAIVHSRVQTPKGTVQISTEIVELRGDLVGKVLYQVTSTVDPTKEKLVNTGDQVFSGTVAGSDPVMIRDTKFHFEAHLKTGEDFGDVYLSQPMAGPEVRCTLHVVGTGKDAGGNPMFNYQGHCRFGRESAEPKHPRRGAGSTS